MANLVLVEGISGSGKTTVSKYMEGDLGFVRYSIDDWIRKHILAESPLELSKFFLLLPIDDDFWVPFLQSRTSYDYTWNDARRIVSAYAERIKHGNESVDPAEQAVVCSVLFAEYMNTRDQSLREGRDVVQEGWPRVMRTFVVADHSEKKYIIKLNVDTEIAIRRKMEQHGWSRKKAEKVVLHEYRFYVPNIPNLNYFERDNNTSEDLEQIKHELNELFI